MSLKGFLQILSRIGSKDRIRMYLLIIFGIVCAVGIGSSYFMGPDNPVEEAAEEVIEDMIEVEIQLPDEPPMRGYIDLSPRTPEGKKPKYINND